MANQSYKKKNTDVKSNSSNRNGGKYDNRKRGPIDRKHNYDARTKSSSTLKDAINDISWYSHNPQMLNDAASIPFSQMLGLPMYFGKFAEDADLQIVDKLPGLMVLRTTPSFGSSTTGLEVNPNSAINIAAQNVYSYVRHANSGHSNYDPVDLMIYFVAMDQAYSFHSELVRLYGLMRFYSGYNRYLGKYLVEALGYDYDDILPQLASLRYIINTYAAKLSTFAVPAIFPIFERHRWIYSNVYMDRASTRAQMYAFVPEYRGVYNEPVTAGEVSYKAGVRARVNPKGYLKTLSDISSLIDEVISPLLHSEDIGIMSGDVLKAYGADKCYFINALAEEFILGPVYVPEVLKQIHNATTVGNPLLPQQNGSSMLVYQEGNSPIVRTWDTTNYIIPCPGLASSTQSNTLIEGLKLVTNPRLLDTDTDNPSAEEVMILTRLMNIPRAIVRKEGALTNINATGDAQVTCRALQFESVYTSMSADAVIEFEVFSGELDGNNHPAFTILYSHIFNVTSTSVLNAKYVYHQAIGDLTKFDWHPTLYEIMCPANVISVEGTTPTDANVIFTMVSDVDNCVLLDKDPLNRMHDVALLSMLNVPSAVLSKGV